MLLYKRDRLFVFKTSNNPIVQSSKDFMRHRIHRIPTITIGYATMTTFFVINPSNNLHGKVWTKNLYNSSVSF